MTDAAPPDQTLPPAPGTDGGPPVRTPRKRFILIGLAIGILIIVLVGLFTSLGTSSSSTSAPRAGGPVPSFTQQNIGPSGPAQVSVPSGRSGTPAVLLFFGNWCPDCHQELPPLAAAVEQQEHAGGALSRIRVIGVDSEDTLAAARSFVHSAGVTFPVAYDPQANVTSGLFYFTGDPYAVFVRGNGTIARIVRGAVLTPTSLTADERALIPSGT
jgi:thiol-disulfide isomerase/thioredoxin